MRFRKLAVWVPIASVALVLAIAGRVSLPFYSLEPGPARDVEPLIQVTGHSEYQSQGRFVMTSVVFRQLTALGILIAWVDPSTAVVPRRDLFIQGETVQQEQHRAISEMDQSKIDAVYIVLKKLTGYPKDHGRGALVESVLPGCSAAGHLYPGDLILSIDGHAIEDRSEASNAIEAAPSGAALAFEIRAAGKTQHVSLVRRPCGDSKKPLVGVGLVDRFPFGISISSGDVGGPSAGLMWALGLYDLLTPGDLTGGRTIAGTGEIGLSGKVLPIGGVGEKVMAAEKAGADLILVPEGNAQAAMAADGGGIEVVAVSSFADALDYLEGTS